MLKVLDFVSEKLGQHKKDSTEDLQKRLDELSILNKMSIALSSGQDLYHLLRLLLEELKKLFIVDEFYIGIYNSETETITFPIYFTDNRFIEINPRNLRERPGLTGTAIFNKKTLYIPDQDEPEVIQRYLPIDIGHKPNRSYIGIPLMLNSSVIGILSVQSALPNTYTPQQIQLLETIAAQSAVAIERARLFSKLQDELAERERSEQALRESESTYRKAIEVAGAIPYRQTYKEGHIIVYDFIGEGILEITGYEQDEFNDEVWESLVEEVHPLGELANIALEEAIARVRTGLDPIWRCEYRILDRKGVARWVYEAAVELRNKDGISHGSIGLFQDITNRKQAEQEILKLNSELEQRVEQRTAQLQEINQTLNNEKAHLEQYNRQRKLMADMTDLLQASLTMEEASRIISTHLKLLFPNQDGALYLISPSNTFEPAATWGDDKSLDVIYVTNDCWGLRRGKPYRFGVGSPNPPCAHIGKEIPFYSLCVPLSAQGENIGNLHISTQNCQDAEFIHEEEQRFIETIADSISLAIANLRLREKLHYEAIRDPLTGLLNRRYLDETLPREIHRTERSNRPISVLMFDIDHFKKFNDTFGHDAGDVVLKNLANLMMSVVRESDIACRYGGEEFTIILPDTPIDVATHRAESLRHEVSTMELHHNGQDLGKVTISIGVATYPQHGTTRDTLIKSADEASYKAKESGRNRVIVCQ